MKYDLSILIVLYNCNMTSSKTINSLLHSNLLHENINVIIYNNGPVLIDSDLSSTYKNIQVIQDISNRALSAIYNEFIEENPSKYYAIYDHDSIITNSYLVEIINIIENKKYELYVPYIKCSGVLTGPSVNGKVVSSRSNKNRLIGITSGVVFSDSIVCLLKNKFKSVFDEHFYLYGVDTSFFLRLRSVNKTSSAFILSEIHHSLSRLENSECGTLFRRKERSYDLGLTIRYYFSFEYFARFLLLLFCKLFNKGKYKNLILKDVLLALIRGKHYRSS